jgi:hypothetical protein
MSAAMNPQIAVRGLRRLTIAAVVAAVVAVAVIDLILSLT